MYVYKLCLAIIFIVYLFSTVYTLHVDFVDNEIILALQHVGF